MDKNCEDEGYCAAGKQETPVIAEVDTLVLGGTTWGVASAVAARRAGARVFLATHRSYLGGDMCAPLRLELEENQPPSGEIGRKIFPGKQRETTPLHVKKVLDKALIDAQVGFVFQAYVTDAIHDFEDRLCGAILAGRFGRRAVQAQNIIDATERASFARQTGAETRSWPKGPVNFHRRTIIPDNQNSHRCMEHTVPIDIPDGGHGALCEAEKIAREATFAPGQMRGADTLFFVPPDPVICRGERPKWDTDETEHVDYFRPAGTERLYVISGCAGIPRENMRELLAPTALLPLAEAVGRHAAQSARHIAPATPKIALESHKEDIASSADEYVEGAHVSRVGGSKTLLWRTSVPEPGGCYDVVVVGGGTAGAAAALASARDGRSVLVIESQAALGGVGTLGLISHPYHGLKIGFAAEVPFPGHNGDEGKTIEDKMDWLRRQLRDAEAEIWYDSTCIGVHQDKAALHGVVAATPRGRYLVEAGVTIDATGSGDVAVLAGAEYMHGATEDGDIALQGVGLPVRPLDKNYVNTDYLLTDECDLIDCWRTYAGTRLVMKEDAYDCGPLIQSRERRRVRGEHVLSYLDQIIGRKYPDSIAVSSSDYDSHGYPNELFFALLPHDEQTRRRNHPAPGGVCYTPYRSLLPRGLDGILAAGLGISMRRDATSMVRMQYDLLNQGYAAGLAASMAVKQEVSPRNVDVGELQRRLIRMGALPAAVLKHEGNVPFDVTAIRAATRYLAGLKTKNAEILDQHPVIDELPDEIRNIWESRHKKFSKPHYDRSARALAIIMAHGREALPELRRAYQKSEGDSRLYCAQIMCVLGEPTAVPELIRHLERVQWDEKIFQGRMAEYAHLPTPIDALVLALGCSRDRRVVPVLAEAINTLHSGITLSHHRAVALAAERMREKDWAKPLADLLKRPQMCGHTMTSLEPLYNFPVERRRREAALREITLARALVRCGDYRGLGRTIMESYCRDWRALLARHARYVLAENET